MYYCKHCKQEWTSQEHKDLNLNYKCPNCPNSIEYGDKKNCPQCNEIRNTSCTACGCGNCLTCGYRFSCMPPLTLDKGIPLTPDWTEDLKKLREAKSILADWQNKQGHDRCWYYPEIFDQLCELFGIENSGNNKLPSRSEFESGCCQYQNEQYGPSTQITIKQINITDEQMKEISNWAIEEVKRTAYEEMWKSIDNLDGY